MKAFINSAASHSLDFDDLHNPSIIHPACVVVPPALAVCEAEHKSGKQLLAAICAGYEASGRIGEALSMQVDYPKGDPDNPLSWQELCHKFMSLAVPVYGKDMALRLQKLVENIELCDDVSKALDECLKE